MPDAPTVSTPSDNSELLTDAQSYGNVYYGTTTIVLNINGTASVQTCTTSSASSCSTVSTVNLASQPIIYVNNASGCTPYAYSPFGASYSKNSTNYYGCSGDVYLSGNYITPVTIAAANNIIINGNVTTSSDSNGNPTGTATLGLVANEFVRVMHGINGVDTSSGCSGGSNNPTYTLTNPVIDAAILALNHSFIVDNYNCGSSPGTGSNKGTLTVAGAIAQDYRGAVGTGTPLTTGYLKNYSYDDRLANILPPYLFDISNSGWHISRETMCVTGSTSTAAGCNAPG